MHSNRVLQPPAPETLLPGQGAERKGPALKEADVWRLPSGEKLAEYALVGGAVARLLAAEVLVTQPVRQKFAAGTGALKSGGRR